MEDVTRTNGPLQLISRAHSLPRTAAFRAEPRNLGFYEPSRGIFFHRGIRLFFHRGIRLFPRIRLFRGLRLLSADFDVFHSNNSENDLDADG